MRHRLQATLACAITFALWRWRGGYLPASLATIATAFALLAWFAPPLYAPFARAFERFGHAVSIAFTWIILGLVYFGVFAPVRIWNALRRHDPLQRRFDPAATTYLHTLPKTPSKFTRQF